EPDTHREWHAAVDSDHRHFSDMVGHAAKWSRTFGKKTLLGGLANADPNFLSMLHDYGSLEHFDAVGVHGFPFSFEFYWEGWPIRVQRLRERLDWCGRPDVNIWITECGYSTWRHDELAQARTFVDALGAPADRVYWYALDDLDPKLSTIDGFHSDEREYHFGLRTADGRNKLLLRLMESHELSSIPNTTDCLYTHSKFESNFTLITGAFADRAASRVRDSNGRNLLFDNLSSNASLARALANRDPLRVADVMDEHALRDAAAGASKIMHAALVADTDRPEWSYRVNTIGTLNVLAAATEAGIAEVELLPPESNHPIIAASLAAAAELVAAYRMKLQKSK
ncbi:MAG: hypothetical protein AAGI46_15795, partial [Planctomycetota bacterium]